MTETPAGKFQKLVAKNQPEIVLYTRNASLDAKHSLADYLIRQPGLVAEQLTEAGHPKHVVDMFIDGAAEANAQLRWNNPLSASQAAANFDTLNLLVSKNVRQSVAGLPLTTSQALNEEELAVVKEAYHTHVLKFAASMIEFSKSDAKASAER